LQIAPGDEELFYAAAGAFPEVQRKAYNPHAIQSENDPIK
jgi:hypothetical protein